MSQASALFAWPVQAAVNRPVPKNKIYAHIQPTAALRALFVAQVEQITWAYKLAPETINLPARPAVPEIDVFELTLKTPELNHAVLRCIDKAMPRPMLFNLRFEDRTQAVAAYKRPSESNPGQWVVGDYHATPWQIDSLARPSLPMVLDLQGLYEQVIRLHLAVPARKDETLREQLDRLAVLSVKQLEAKKIATRLAQEKQFNRKVALNAELRNLQQTIDTLAA
jgi:hypothetical protein